MMVRDQTKGSERRVLQSLLLARQGTEMKALDSTSREPVSVLPRGRRLLQTAQVVEHCHGSIADCGMKSKVWRFVGVFVDLFGFVPGGVYVFENLSMLFA